MREPVQGARTEGTVKITFAPRRFARFSRDRLTARLCAVAALSVWAFAPQADAMPVTYELDVVGSDVSGSLGATTFSNALMFLTFKADTTKVIPYSRPKASGYDVLVGTATVIIRDDSGGIIGQATFLPSAGIYVGVDNTNNGIGFGSFGVPPTDPSFPGQPAYPSSMIPLNPYPNVTTYNLRSNFSTGGDAISCVNFPAACGAAIALPTTSGDLILNQFPFTQAFFSATTRGGIMPIVTKLLLE
jgi:hypothetical protein